jgi:hypothetical protein
LSKSPTSIAPSVPRTIRRWFSPKPDPFPVDARLEELGVGEQARRAARDHRQRVAVAHEQRIVAMLLLQHDLRIQQRRLPLLVERLVAVWIDDREVAGEQVQTERAREA